MKIQYKEKIYEIEKPQKISQILKKEIENSEYPVVAAIYNNKYVNLDSELTKDGKIELIDISLKQGMRIYRRTLIYLFAMVARKLYPESNPTVNYYLSNSTYCDLGNVEVTEEIVKKLEQEIRKVVESNLPIKEVVMTRKEAEKFFKEKNTNRGKLQYDLETNNEIRMNLCGEYFNYCYGILANNTSVIKLFELIKYDKGFLIMYPTRHNPKKMDKIIQSKKINWALNEYNDIHKILNINTVYKLNTAVEENRIKDIIMLDEALHEKKIANIADNVAQNRNIKMILIAGPSSSGKTTFAQRLGIQLRINKIKPVTISVDNYFVERQDTPRDENGKYDFEALEAIDLKLFNDHLTKLLNGEEIEMPHFDFHVGTKKYDGKKLKLNDDEILVIEGIHCLNDKLTKSIPINQKFKVYISALPILNMDRYTKVSSTDTRLIRRMVRDYQFRGYSAKHTIENWPSVIRGEEKNIYPFQEEADAIFNTSLIYELGVLKGIAEPLLKEISSNELEHAEAERLLDLLKYIKAINPEIVPTNSLLKEFIGGGDFKY